MSWNLVSTPHITEELLIKTLRREICGFRVPDYCSRELAGTLADAILSDFNRTNYGVRWCAKNVRPASAEEFLSLPFAESDVMRGGPTSATESVNGIDDNPLAIIRRMRQITWPHLMPIDRLRLELDETAPLGALLYIMPDGRKSMVGLPRIMETSKELLHADTGRKGCLTANIYLKLPVEGGATRIWNYRGEYESSFGSYLFGEGEIPVETEFALLEPSVGELVIWNPMSPHAVSPFESGPRVSVQSWLKFVFDEGDDERFRVEMLN